MFLQHLQYPLSKFQAQKLESFLYMYFNYFHKSKLINFISNSFPFKNVWSDHINFNYHMTNWINIICLNQCIVSFIFSLSPINGIGYAFSTNIFFSNIKSSLFFKFKILLHGLVFLSHNQKNQFFRRFYKKLCLNIVVIFLFLLIKITQY